MKKLLFAIIAVFALLDCSVAHASEEGVEVTAGEMVVRELSQSEMTALLEVMEAEEMGGETLPTMSARTSYTAYEYSRVFDFSLEGRRVASADARCIVWHYTDGKVHLYRRTITMTRLASFDADRTYGRIVNTDGSLSYTEGDIVTIIDYDAFWDYAIDFRVTPTEASFNCYEV